MPVISMVAMRMKSTKVGGYILIMLAIIVIATVIYKNANKAAAPIVFSPKSMIDAIWERYKADYLESGTGRTMDPERDYVTTSEGESYTMLRAVWMDDHTTFDQSWQWTQNNLGQSQFHLFSWLFGRRPNGTYGVLTAQKGQNTASDADTDIALALTFAYARWRDPKYLASAKSIMDDIWSYEVITVNGKPYLAADNVEKNFNAGILVNPSYFAPYAYRIFAEVDPGHDWNGLIDTSYAILKASIQNPLDRARSAGLPPDWIQIDRLSADIMPSAKGMDTNFGYDALRVPWRIALDWYWYREPRAAEILRSMSFLNSEWTSKGVIYDMYAHDGTAVDKNESPAMYGGTIPEFMVMNAGDATSLYKTKLLSLFNPDSNSWKVKLGYYSDNWAWFGIALYNDELPNLWATVTH